MPHGDKSSLAPVYSSLVRPWQRNRSCSISCNILNGIQGLGVYMIAFVVIGLAIVNMQLSIKGHLMIVHANTNMQPFIFHELQARTMSPFHDASACVCPMPMSCELKEMEELDRWQLYTDDNYIYSEHRYFFSFWRFSIVSFCRADMKGLAIIIWTALGIWPGIWRYKKYRTNIFSTNMLTQHFCDSFFLCLRNVPSNKSFHIWSQ